jgi:hypothetical protein
VLLDGLEVGDDVGEPRPPPAVVCGPAPPVPGDDAERLAGKSSGDNIDSRSVGSLPPASEASHVAMFWYLRPMFGEHRAAERINFNLADHVHAGLLKT